jgi:hypothetical protein
MGFPQALHSMHDVPATTVVGGDGQGQSVIVSGQLFGLGDITSELFIETRQIADDLQADFSFMQLADFSFEHLYE